jgi:hypothetical protein
MSYIQGVSRHQHLLFPEVIDEYIGSENPVRFLDAFVESLDLAHLGFQRRTLSHNRASSIPSQGLMKTLSLWLFKSASFKPEIGTRTQRNVELM